MCSAGAVIYYDKNSNVLNQLFGDYQKTVSLASCAENVHITCFKVTRGIDRQLSTKVSFYFYLQSNARLKQRYSLHPVNLFLMGTEYGH